MLKNLFNKILIFLVVFSLFASPFFYFYPQKAEANEITKTTQNILAGAASTIAGCYAASFLGNLGKKAASTVISTASVPVSDSGVKIEVSASTVKECALDGMLNVFKKEILEQMINATTDWINGGFDGSPKFVENFDDFFADTVSEVVGSYIQGSGLKFLCQPFQINLKYALYARFTQPRRKEGQCTLEKIEKNIDKAVKDLQNYYSWRKFITITTDSNSNVFGAYFQASRDIQRAIGRENTKKLRDANRGKGFMSWKTCKDVKQADGTVKPDCTIATPGSIIVSQTDKVLGTDLQELQLADEFDELVAALVGALLGNVLGDKGLISMKDNFLDSSGNRERREAYFEKLKSNLRAGYSIKKYNIAIDILRAAQKTVENSRPYFNRARECWQALDDYVKGPNGDQDNPIYVYTGNYRTKKKESAFGSERSWTYFYYRFKDGLTTKYVQDLQKMNDDAIELVKELEDEIKELERQKSVVAKIIEVFKSNASFAEISKMLKEANLQEINVQNYLMKKEQIDNEYKTLINGDGGGYGSNVLTGGAYGANVFCKNNTYSFSDNPNLAGNNFMIKNTRTASKGNIFSLHDSGFLPNFGNSNNSDFTFGKTMSYIWLGRLPGEHSRGTKVEKSKKNYLVEVRNYFDQTLFNLKRTVGYETPDIAAVFGKVDKGLLRDVEKEFAYAKTAYEKVKLIKQSLSNVESAYRMAKEQLEKIQAQQDKIPTIAKDNDGNYLYETENDYLSSIKAKYIAKVRKENGLEDGENWPEQATFEAKWDVEQAPLHRRFWRAAVEGNYKELLPQAEKLLDNFPKDENGNFVYNEQDFDSYGVVVFEKLLKDLVSKAEADYEQLLSGVQQGIYLDENDRLMQLKNGVSSPVVVKIDNNGNVLQAGEPGYVSAESVQVKQVKDGYEAYEYPGREIKKLPDRLNPVINPVISPELAAEFENKIKNMYDFAKSLESMAKMRAVQSLGVSLPLRVNLINFGIEKLIGSKGEELEGDNPGDLIRARDANQEEYLRNPKYTRYERNNRKIRKEITSFTASAVVNQAKLESNYQLVSLAMEDLLRVGQKFVAKEIDSQQAYLDIDTNFNVLITRLGSFSRLARNMEGRIKTAENLLLQIQRDIQRSREIEMKNLQKENQNNNTSN